MLSLAIFLVAFPLLSLSSCEVIFRFALSHLPGGVQLFCFSLGALPVRSSGFVRGVVWSSWLSPLPAAWLWIVVFSVPVVWLVLRLPSLWPYTRPLFGLLAVPPFLPSGSRRCVFSLTLGFSVPLPVSSSWAPLYRFS